MTDLQTLLYPFGFLSCIAFGLRFLIQWIQSEKEQKSTNPIIFWQLSLLGNSLLFLHCLIQSHFPMCLAQSINAVLAFRNIQFINKSETPFSSVLLLLFFTLSLTTLLFIPGGVWFGSFSDTIPLWIHLAGITGIFFQSLRFWIQWWQLEQSKTSNLSESFWWLSLCGAYFCSFYFLVLRDWVNFIGPFVSLVPFTRNLWLIYKDKRKREAI